MTGTRVKKTAKGCGCFEAARAEAKKQGFDFDTSLQINFSTGKGSLVGPFLAVHWTEKKNKSAPIVTCAYCPFCGKKSP